MDEDFATVKDSVPVKFSLLNLFNKGFIIGFLVCLSIFGLLQQAQGYLEPDNIFHSLVIAFVEKFWFHVAWYFWFACLALSALAFFKARNRIKDK